MSNFWKLRRQFVGNPGEPEIQPGQWPASVELTFFVEPADFYGAYDRSTPRSTMVGETGIEIRGETGLITVTSSGELPPLHLTGQFDHGTLTIDGQRVTLRAQATDPAHVDSLVNWVDTIFCEYIAVQIGVFCAVKSVQGTIAGKHVGLIYSADTYSTALANIDTPSREELVRRALSGPATQNPGYSRYVASCRYFCQALRLVSPAQVLFSPSTIHAEVLLNLAKSLEMMFSPSRDAVRAKLALLGYTDSQVESQIISILIVRNEIDVGHPGSASLDTAEISVMRRFVHRAMENVGAVLRKVGDRLHADQQYLSPLIHGSDATRAAFTGRVTEYLAHPRLDPTHRTPITLSGT